MVNFRDHIESNPDVMLGKPVIQGTRITVELLLRKLADGYGAEEILEMYPHLKPEDLQAISIFIAKR